MAEIKKAGVPDIDTIGLLGDIYTDTNTGNKYKLVYIVTTTTYDGVTVEYDWKRLYKESSDADADSDSGLGSINANLVMDLEALTKWFNFVYYDTVDQAITDIISGTVGENATVENNDSEVAVYIDDIPYMVLLKDCEISSTIVASVDMVIVLNGFTMSAKDINMIEGRSNKLKIDGKVSGSKMDISSSIQGDRIKMLHVFSGECEIDGGEFNSTTSGAGVLNDPHGMITIDTGVKLITNNAKLLAKDDNGGVINAVNMAENSSLNGSNCIIESDSQYSPSTDAIYGHGAIKLSYCDIQGKSNHTLNADKSYYGATSRAINSLAGSVHLTDCHVRGTHSGFQVKGDLYVDGCVCEGYSHGGIYVSSSEKTVYVRNSILQQCGMPDGYIDDGLAGTNQAGIYMGGASKINLYIDNCNIYGAIQPVVLRSSGGEQNNHLYISNSNINLNYSGNGIRNDGSHQTHLGVGNNFGINNLKYKRNYEETAEDYSAVMPNNN